MILKLQKQQLAFCCGKKRSFTQSNKVDKAHEVLYYKNSALKILCVKLSSKIVKQDFKSIQLFP
jgi:hypothetical protein